MDLAQVSIYHLTHIENLPSIIAMGGLGCTNQLARRSVSPHSSANPEIQEVRARTKVPCRQGGTLHDYVPFFFAPRSPMLYVVAEGWAADCKERQEPLLQLRTTVAAVVAEGRPFVFTDGHAIKALTGYYDDPLDLGMVDWAAIDSEYWNDTAAFPDRRRRRQAEFLVHEKAPWRLIQEIGVFTPEMQQKVEQEIARVGHKPAVTVRREWYY